MFCCTVLFSLSRKRETFCYGLLSFKICSILEEACFDVTEASVPVNTNVSMAQTQIKQLNIRLLSKLDNDVVLQPTYLQQHMLSNHL